MHADRLIKLAELLEADAINPNGIKFDLGIWGETVEATDVVGVSCGTQACAMGLAVLSGEFAQYGLRNGSHSRRSIVPEMKDSEEGGLYAAAELFDIDYSNASRLFCVDYYPDGSETTGAEGELMVATRIREFVADNQPADTTI